MGVIKKEIFLTERSEFFSVITDFLLHGLCPSQDSPRAIFPEHIYTNITTHWLIRGWNDCTPFYENKKHSMSKYNPDTYTHLLVLGGKLLFIKKNWENNEGI